MVDNDEDETELQPADVRRQTTLYRRCLRSFQTIAGYDGVFVCSSCPQWMMMGPRRVVRQHPLSREWGGVISFTEFNTASAPHGFVTLCDNGDMRIGCLDTQLNYDDSMITQKTPLKRTVTHVAYHAETGLYAIASYVRVPARRYPPFRNEEPETAEEVPTDPRYYPATTSRLSLPTLTPANGF